MPELRSRPPQQHAGATLIEVLVAFLIVSFGMLALLALQNNAIQYNKTTEYRSLATMLAMDLAERMRANREQALGGAYDLAGSPSAPDAMPERVPCFSAATEEQPAVSCTSATLALQDTSEWQRLLFMNLPGGRAHVEVIRDEADDPCVQGLRALAAVVAGGRFRQAAQAWRCLGCVAGGLGP